MTLVGGSADAALRVAADLYSPSKLVRFFHAWQHMDFSFDPVTVPSTGDYSATNTAYMESLAMAAAMVAAPCILFALIFLIVNTCCACKRATSYSNSHARSVYKKRRGVIAVFLTLSLILLAYCLYCNSVISTRVEDGVSDVQTINNRYNRAIDDAKALASLSAQLAPVAQELQSDLEEAPSNIKQDMDKIVSALSAFSQQANSVINQAPKIDVYDVLHDVTHYDNVRAYAEYGVLAFGLLVAGLIFGCTQCRSGFCLCMSSTLMTFFVFLVLTVVSAGFIGALVGLSDACMSPTPFIEFQIGPNKYATYYLECTAATPNPFEDPFNELNAAIKTLSAAASSVSDYAQQNSPADVAAKAEEIAHGSSTLSQSTQATYTEITCETYNGLLGSAISTTCGDISGHIAALAGSMLVLALVLAIMAMCGAKAAQIIHPQYALRNETEAHEVQPLLPRHQQAYVVGTSSSTATAVVDSEDTPDLSYIQPPAYAPPEEMDTMADPMPLIPGNYVNSFSSINDDSESQGHRETPDAEHYSVNQWEDEGTHVSRGNPFLESTDGGNGNGNGNETEA